MDKIYVAALNEEVVGLDYFHVLGVGKINATLKTIELISKFNPNEVINFGTAGALNKNLNGIIECTKFYQRDMDCRGLLDFKLGETPFDRVNEIIISENGYSCGTGDNFVTKKIEMDLDVVDMEAYALAKVCYKRQVPFVSFKYITDGADEQAHEDWEANLADGIVEFKKKVLDKLPKS